ncbi:MAG: hypothetical protein JRG80_22910 [Deltaproteobacteria bacterium]|nr:hypothetical protein [Deltaproteobacteria bacterium]MBW2402064.1 hypothetical protein [Deltaproteobacteria bacterium]MBW2665028.1 hypothetical protein [Deltaproteobacteria bacterium]
MGRRASQRIARIAAPKLAAALSGDAAELRQLVAVQNRPFHCSTVDAFAVPGDAPSGVAAPAAAATPIHSNAASKAPATCEEGSGVGEKGMRGVYLGVVIVCQYAVLAHYALTASGGCSYIPGPKHGRRPWSVRSDTRRADDVHAEV